MGCWAYSAIVIELTSEILDQWVSIFPIKATILYCDCCTCYIRHMQCNYISLARIKGWHMVDMFEEKCYHMAILPSSIYVFTNVNECMW